MVYDEYYNQNPEIPNTIIAPRPLRKLATGGFPSHTGSAFTIVRKTTPQFKSEEEQIKQRREEFLGQQTKKFRDYINQNPDGAEARFLDEILKQEKDQKEQSRKEQAVGKDKKFELELLRKVASSDTEITR